MVHHPSSTFIQTEQVYNHEKKKILFYLDIKKFKYKFKNKIGFFV